jgi:hypothetical protein
VHRADNLTTFKCRLSRNLGASTSWNPQGLSRVVMGLIYLYLYHITGSLLPLQRSGNLTFRACRTSEMVFDLVLIEKISSLLVAFSVSSAWERQKSCHLEIYTSFNRVFCKNERSYHNTIRKSTPHRHGYLYITQMKPTTFLVLSTTSVAYKGRPLRPTS